MISVAGSIQSNGETGRSGGKDKEETPASPKDKPEGAGFLRGFGAMFGFGGKDAKGGDGTSRGVEFPWTKYLIEEDVMKKWSSVDMK